jgi:hypothetical protein
VSHGLVFGEAWRAPLRSDKSMNREQPSREKKKPMNDGWWLLAFLAVWFILQIWILPKMGVST